MERRSLQESTSHPVPFRLWDRGGGTGTCSLSTDTQSMVGSREEETTQDVPVSKTEDRVLDTHFVKFLSIWFVT